MSNIDKKTFDAIRPDWAKWDTAKKLKDVIWVCRNCNEPIDDGKLIDEPFMGSVHCGNCNTMLTERCNGGQNPFNMTFVDPNAAPVEGKWEQPEEVSIKLPRKVWEDIQGILSLHNDSQSPAYKYNYNELIEEQLNQQP